MSRWKTGVQLQNTEEKYTEGKITLGVRNAEINEAQDGTNL